MRAGDPILPGDPRRRSRDAAIGVAWSPAEDDRLRDLWADRTMSSGAIGIAMGRSKNSVVGRAGRLGLEVRGSPVPGVVARSRVERTPRRVKPAAKTLKPMRLPDPMPVAVPIAIMDMPLRRDSAGSARPSTPCEWPLWGPDTPRAQRMFCGAERFCFGSPYCERHHTIAHVKPIVSDQAEA